MNESKGKQVEVILNNTVCYHLHFFHLVKVNLFLEAKFKSHLSRNDFQKDTNTLASNGLSDSPTSG